MASNIIYITLLVVLYVLYLPCPLSAEEPFESPDEQWLNEYCWERCVLEEYRFPCAEGARECGDCLAPISKESNSNDRRCEVVKDNHEHVQKILDIINKRDEGTGVELDTGGVPNPPPDAQNPPALNQEQDQADVGAEENQADPDSDQQMANRGDSTGGSTIEEGDPSFQESNAAVQAHETDRNNGSVILLEEWQFILIVVGCVAVAIIGVAVAFICWYKIQTTSKAQNEADYPAYGVTGPGTQIGSSMNNGDRKLAQSAQMYHYQHQKQQMIAMEKREKGDVARDASDYDSEEENEDGDLTVYECPGLAPTGEMQVKNPLFAEDAYPKPGGGEEGEEKQ